MPSKAKPIKSKSAKLPAASGMQPLVAVKSRVNGASTGTTSAGSTGRAMRNTALCVLLAVATFAVYFRASTNPFVNYDDQVYVTENSNIQKGLTLATLRWALVSADASNWHPLTWLSHTLDFQLFGFNPAGHHITSILLHIFNVLLLFLLLVRVTGATTRSLLVAALFALHPINVESVAWVAERKTVLCMFFSLLTLGAYGWYARGPDIRRYLAVVVLFVLALAAKPMAVTLPFVLLLVDFWPLHRVRGLPPPAATFPLQQSSFRSLILEKLPLLLLSAASSVITMFVQGATVSTNAGLSLPVRLANALFSYSMYIVKTFWPLHLAAYYPYEGSRLSGWQILLCLLFLALCSGWVWRKRSNLCLPVGWFWFLGTLIPVIGFVQVGDQGMADRYAYFPFIGIFVILVWSIADWVETHHFNSHLFTAGAAVILAVLSFQTWRQIGTWHSSYDLWTHALRVTEDNYMAEDYVGTAVLVETYERTGQRYSNEALAHFQKAATINPRDAISHLNIGADYHEHARLQEAIQEYRTVTGITRDPHLLFKSLFGLGAANHQLGNEHEAIQAYQAALEMTIDPREVAKTLLGMGDVYRQLGDTPAARQYYQKALKADPKNQTAFMNTGKLAMDERIRQLAISASALPSPRAYLQLGQLQVVAGRIPEARASFQTALKLDPKSPETQSVLNSLTNQTGH